jgi:hypothetical protein
MIKDIELAVLIGVKIRTQFSDFQISNSPYLCRPWLFAKKTSRAAENQFALVLKHFEINHNM